MPSFSKRSLERLRTCDVRLQVLMEEVVKDFDCTILEGYRTQARQEALFEEGRTKVHYPHSKHNTKPSMAVDVAPYPIDWEDRERFTYFAGTVRGVAFTMGLRIRWGGDFNQNDYTDDEDFSDMPHFELVA